MKVIKLIFDLLQSTNSKLEKERILQCNKDNPLLKVVLHFILNPLITTGLSSKKINKLVTAAPTKRFTSAEEVMEYLEQNNTGTDEVIANIQSFMNGNSEEMQSFYTSIFTKSIKLGCAATTVNKVFGKGFIPQFECMLAEKYFNNVDKVDGKDFTITLKLDGIRALIIKSNNSISIFSRQGQLIEGLLEIEQELLNHPSKQFVLDGELLISNTKGLLSKEQYKSTTKIVRRDGEKRGITFWAFDILKIDDFYNQECVTPYMKRRKLLEMLFQETQYTKILPLMYSGSDTSKIIELLDKVRADGEEGIMVNINDSPYEFKRTQNLLKVKIMQDCDLQIVGFEEGQGRLTGTLGRLNVEYKGNILGVGSGFTDEQREYFWSNREELINRVVSINYFEETQDKNGNVSLRFPVFKELREAGKEVSYG